MLGVDLICLQRQSCVEKAREVLKEPTDVPLDQYVTDRFLCSGGSSGYKDAISCKGLGLCTFCSFSLQDLSLDLCLHR